MTGNVLLNGKKKRLDYGVAVSASCCFLNLWISVQFEHEESHVPSNWGWHDFKIDSGGTLN